MGGQSQPADASPVITCRYKLLVSASSSQPAGSPAAPVRLTILLVLLSRLKEKLLPAAGDGSAAALLLLLSPAATAVLLVSASPDKLADCVALGASPAVVGPGASTCCLLLLALRFGVLLLLTATAVVAPALVARLKGSRPPELSPVPGVVVPERRGGR